MASAQPQSFAFLLRRYRLAAGLTQEQLAERARLSVGAVGALERGLRRAPHHYTLALLADALGLSASERAQLEAAARSARSAATSPPAPASRPAAAPPLVGRVRELARLGRHLAGDGPPLLLLAGEPGIGKTRLLQETATRAHEAGWTVLTGGCTRRSGQEPFAPLLAALARFISARPATQLRADLDGCALLVRLLPELAERTVVPAPAWALAPEQERRLMFDAVGRFLANVAGPAGTLLVLDDLQWTGSDALDLLAALVRAGPDYPLRLIGAYRATEVDAAHALAALQADLAREDLVDEARLGPLASEEARHLLASLLADADGAERKRLTATLLVRAGGVPFFLVSCAREATAGGMEDGEVPWTVQQSLRQRVAALPEAAQALLGLAAVAGRELLRPVLVAAAEGARVAADRTVLLGAIEVACAAGLLAEDERGDYRFAHDLIREAALSNLGAARRAAWHLAWAEALEAITGGALTEQLAYHFTRGDAPQRAIPYIERAGDRAAALHANVEAAGYYRDLVEQLDHLGRLSEAAHARVKLSNALRAATRYDEALTALEQAMGVCRQTQDWEGMARATAQLGHVHVLRGTPREGMERVMFVLSVLDESKPSHAQGALQVALAELLLFCGRYEEQEVAAQRALRIARMVGDERLAVHAQIRQIQALYLLGRFRSGIALVEEAMPSIQRAGDLTSLRLAHFNVGMMYDCMGAFESARRELGRAAELAERMGDRPLLAAVTARQGVNAFYRGEWDDAQAHFEQVAELLVDVSRSWPASAAPSLLGMLQLVRGEPQAAAQMLDEAIVLALRTNDLATPYAVVAFAEYDLLREYPDEARAQLERLLARVHEQSIMAHMVLPALAWAHANIGQTGQAESMLQQCIARARAENARLILVDALWVLGLLATRQRRWPEAEAALDECLALCRAMPCPYAEAKALYWYGHLRAAQGDPEQAYEQYRAALAICQRLDEGMYRPHIERALTQLGGPPW